tara:strand:+ start:356 stop:847 length:492 start_codon:yes stop_codon:yes gene_type:complete
MCIHSVSYEKKISSSKKELWDLISSPEHLNLVHPFCKSNESINWDKKKSKDVLVYLNGMVYFRDFTSWEDGNGYELMIGRKRGKKSRVVWKIKSDDKSVSLKITVYPYLLSNWPRVMSLIPYKFIISPLLKSYLKSVISGINYYLINQKPVEKNHFGKHIWFS